jgi:hypothetical protein
MLNCLTIIGGKPVCTPTFITYERDKCVLNLGVEDTRRRWEVFVLMVETRIGFKWQRSGSDGGLCERYTERLVYLRTWIFFLTRNYGPIRRDPAL